MLMGVFDAPPLTVSLVGYRSNTADYPSGVAVFFVRATFVVVVWAGIVMGAEACGMDA